MTLPAVVPFRPGNPKSRLSCVLDEEERALFAGAMLRDVLSALHQVGCDPWVMSTAPYPLAGERVVVNPAGLNESLNALLSETDGSLLILMADLPLVTPDSIRKLVRTKQDMAIAPGRGGGTNAIYLRSASRFRVDYYQASFVKHMRIAAERGLSCEVADSFRLHTDVDEKDDLVELLIHGTGESRSMLEKLGFSLSIDKGRVGADRK